MYIIPDDRQKHNANSDFVTLKINYCLCVLHRQKLWIMYISIRSMNPSHFPFDLTILVKTENKAPSGLSSTPSRTDTEKLTKPQSSCKKTNT